MKTAHTKTQPPTDENGRPPETIRGGDWAVINNAGHVVRVFDNEPHAWLWLNLWSIPEEEPYSLGVYE
jgi:hypothetical protein